MSRSSIKISVDRLEKLRKDHKHTQKYIANAIGISLEGYRKILEKGTTSEYTLKLFQKFYDVRKEYLQGIDDYETYEDFITDRIDNVDEIMADKIKYLYRLGYRVNPWDKYETETAYSVSRWDHISKDGTPSDDYIIDGIGAGKTYIVTEKRLNALINLMDKTVDALLRTALSEKI